MAKNRTAKHEARRSAREDQRQGDREARAGERADYLKVRAGNAAYDETVNRDMVRLRGRSESQLARDDERGAASPLGMVSPSKSEKESRRR